MSSLKEGCLSDLLQLGNGKVKPNETGSIPIYGGNGILGFSNKSNYNDETVIIGRVGAYCGSVYYSKTPVWVSDNALAAKPKNSGSASYLYYFLKNLNLNNYAEGSSHPLVTQTLLNSIEISYFDKADYQQVIAEVLSSLDDKIDLLHRNNKTLEQMAETLFRQWFVVEAKEEWEVVKLGNYIQLVSGYSYRSVDLTPSSTALVTLKNFERTGGFRLDGFKEYSGKYKDDQLVRMGDLVVAHTDITQEAEVLGNPAIIIDDGRYEKLVISTDLVKVIPTSFLSLPYLYYLMRQPDFKHYCLGASNGTTVLHLSKKALPDYEFPIPPATRIKEFTTIVLPLFEKVAQNVKQLNQLEKTRDTLLPKLMSGQVRVKTD